MIIFSQTNSTENSLEALSLISRSFALRHFAPLSLIEMLHLLSSKKIANIEKDKWLGKIKDERIFNLAGISKKNLLELHNILHNCCDIFLFSNHFTFVQILESVKNQHLTKEEVNSFNKEANAFISRHAFSQANLAPINIDAFNREMPAGGKHRMHLSPVLLPSVHSLLATLKVVEQTPISNSLNNGVSYTSETLRGFKDTSFSMHGPNTIINLLQIPYMLPQLIAQHNALIIIANDKNYTEIKPGLWAHKSAKVHETVTVANFEKTAAFTVLQEDVEVQPYVCFVGSNHVGPGSIVKTHATITFSTVGRYVRIGGEVTNTSIDDYSNKAHDGFIGHSIVGSWVNIGAGATFSNLKSTYGEVKLAICMREMQGGTKLYNNTFVPSGQTFFGSVVGDYAKIGIGSRIATGKSIGMGALVGGDVNAAKPHFYFRKGKRLGVEVEVWNLASFLTTQRRMMARRGMTMKETEERFLTRLHAIYSV